MASYVNRFAIFNTLESELENLGISDSDDKNKKGKGRHLLDSKLKTDQTTKIKDESNIVIVEETIEEVDGVTELTIPVRSKKQKKKDFYAFFNPILKTIDNFCVVELIDHCNGTKLSTIGSPAKLKKQLKELYKTNCEKIFDKMSWNPHPFVYQQYFQYFDYLVVIDFEATCYQVNPPNFQHEIIQFPAVLIDVLHRTVVDEFNIFIKPKLNPVLSDFCTQLTGITQDLVDDAPDFEEGLDLFKKWLTHHELGSRHRFTIVCDGAWDMGKFMHTQCELSKIPYPTYAQRWINIRKSFSNFYNVKWFNLRVMLGLIGQPFQGRPHDGLDDSRNIGNIVNRLLNDGCVLVENERILLGKSEQERNAAVQEHERKMYSLCTVENMSKNQFFRFYNTTGVPYELELQPAVDKENIGTTAKASGNNGGGGNVGRQNRKRSKPKFRKWNNEPKEPIPTTSTKKCDSEVLVVSARGLEE